MYWHRHLSTFNSLPHFGFENDDRYFAFCVAKDWLQDTGEVLPRHGRRGFDPDPHFGYLEFWGVLQAAHVQQDALAELIDAVRGQKRKPDTLGGVGMKTLRNFRNRAVGHPVRKDRGTDGRVLRLVIPRQHMSYGRVSVAKHEDEQSWTTTINLGQMLDAHDQEAAQMLQKAFVNLKTLIWVA